MSIAYLSLGSNIGDRRGSLAEVVRLLSRDDLTILRVSSMYETEPQEFADQPWFLNTVIEVDTSLSPRDLLSRCLEAEISLGRRRTTPKGPRTIDIDIVLYDDLVIDSPGLSIPHPRMAERRFVLEPLSELAPTLRHPVLGKAIQELLTATLDQKVARAES